MGDSINHYSSIAKALIDRDATTTTTTTRSSSSEEESGWTSYFEELTYNNSDGNNHNQTTHDHQSNVSTTSLIDACSSSLMSDAGSLPPRKSIACNANTRPCHDVVLGSTSSVEATPNNIPKKLKFNITERAGEMIPYLHDSLEDTASSPVSSPKVSSNRSPNDMNPRKN